KYILDWPNRELGSQPIIETYEISSKPTVFDQDTPAESIATYKLTDPIMIGHEDEQSTMDTIALIPYKNEHFPYIIDGLQAYLISTNNNFIKVGEVTNIGRANTIFTIDLSGETG